MKNIKRFENFNNHNSGLDKFYQLVSFNNEKEIEIDEKKVKEIFSFVGDGVDDVDLETEEINSYKSPTVYQNELKITFTDAPYGYVSMEHWKKLEDLLEKYKKEDSEFSYVINTTRNIVTLTFDDKYLAHIK